MNSPVVVRRAHPGRSPRDQCHSLCDAIRAPSAMVAMSRSRRRKERCVRMRQNQPRSDRRTRQGAQFHAIRSGERFSVPRSGLFGYHQAHPEESSGECRLNALPHRAEGRKIFRLGQAALLYEGCLISTFAACFETPASPAPQHEAQNILSIGYPHPEAARRAVSKDEAMSRCQGTLV